MKLGEHRVPRRAKSKLDLRRDWERLRIGHGVDPYERGYLLEKLLFRLLDHEGLVPSASYRTSGEQIDGFFQWDGRFFHFECKWQKNPVGLADIYAFRGKFEGKLIGTLGVFVSVSDFADDLPESLRFGKMIDVILFNGDDLMYCLQEQYSFREVLHAKLRRAAQYGEPFYPFKSKLSDLGS